MGNTNCSYCKVKGLSENFVFCPYCGKKLIIKGVCRSCGFNNSKSAKFCQECGASLTDIENKNNHYDSNQVLVEEPIPNKGLTIEFGYSSSANYDRAISQAKVFPTFKIIGESNKATYRINFDQSSIESTMELVKLLRGWKSSRIYIEGERTTWDAVYSFSWCYENRCSSFKPDLYCYGYENNFDLNIWGCVQARLPFTDHAPWTEWGKWLDKDGTWQFDKERIRHELQIEIFKYRFCPAIRLDLIEDALTAFPDVVNPNKDKNWKFVESWSDDGLSTGLIIRMKRFGIEEKVVMKGVAPNGIGAIREIVSKMKNRFPEEVLR